MNQANTIAATFSGFNIPMWVSGFFIAFLVALVIIGGIRRIAIVASRLVPTMAVIYVGSALYILFTNFSSVVPSFISIFEQAFSLEAGWGGLFTVMMWGVRRGLYSNEAGQGSAPIAHAAAKTKESAREGVVALMGPFVDTILICTMTGLAILSTGVLQTTDLTGAELTRAAFEAGFPFAPEIGGIVITASVFLFAYSTMVAWSYYGDRSIEYLIGPQAIRPYRWVYVFFNFLGAILPLTFVWNFGDIALSLMTIPNLIGVVLLTATLKKISEEYFARTHLTYREKLNMKGMGT
jgi:AGCS family alanine or glycine:cation symporter